MTIRTRFIYSKRGGACFVPHIALAQLFSRSAVRAGFKLTMTQGFSPRAKISFGPELPAGVVALNEPVDMYFDDDNSHENLSSEILEIMNSSLPEGFNISHVIFPDDNSPAIGKLCTHAEYLIRLSHGGKSYAEIISHENWLDDSKSYAKIIAHEDWPDSDKPYANIIAHEDWSDDGKSYANIIAHEDWSDSDKPYANIIAHEDCPDSDKPYANIIAHEDWLDDGISYAKNFFGDNIIAHEKSEDWLRFIIRAPAQNPIGGFVKFLVSQNVIAGWHEINIVRASIGQFNGEKIVIE